MLSKTKLPPTPGGTLARYPNVRTIIEIGGQDSKLILIQGGVVTDYTMNTLCAAGTGAFLSSQAKRLGIAVEGWAMWHCGPSVRPKSLPLHRLCRIRFGAQGTGRVCQGRLWQGLCNAVVPELPKQCRQGKQILEPIVFQGGVSKNKGVVQAFQLEWEAKFMWTVIPT